MKQALEIAQKGRGFTSPNPMVGAVIVKNDKVIAKGYHEAAGKAHAEVKAIEIAGPEAVGATLYVTLEPCNHFGRTPPCTQRILQAGIGRVVVAMKDPNPQVPGGGIEYLQSNGVDVKLGVCEKEAIRLNEVFIKYVRTKRPFVAVKCASTLDGQIATRTGDSRWVTGPEAREYVHHLRHAMDAIMVGVGTIETDDPRLTTRIDGLHGLNPKRIILDTRLRIPEHARVLRQPSESDTIIVVGPAACREKLARIQHSGIRVLHSPLKNGWIDLDPLMDRLGAMGITSILIEGGGRVVASALSSEIVDKIYFFYAPKILGGNDGVPVCFGKGAERINQCIRVEEMTVERLGDDILVEGYIRYSAPAN